MAKHRQESIEGWEQDMRDLARAERELAIEHWVRVSIGYYDPYPRQVTLHTYDLPRGFLEKYVWVITWRRSRLQCQFPRKSITTWYGYYDKTTGLRTDFNSCLSRLASAKAQITKVRRSERQYVTGMKEKYPMFYDPGTDPELTKFRDKVARKEENCRTLAGNIRIAVENHKKQNHDTNTENFVAVQDHRAPERVQAGA